MWNSVSEVRSKSIETEAVFTKKEMNNKWNINFIQVSPLAIKHSYSNEFYIDRSTYKTTLLI